MCDSLRSIIDRGDRVEAVRSVPEIGIVVGDKATVVEVDRSDTGLPYRVLLSTGRLKGNETWVVPHVFQKEL